MKEIKFLQIRMLKVKIPLNRETKIPEKWKKMQVTVDKMNIHQIKVRKPNKQKALASEKGKRFSMFHLRSAVFFLC